MAAHAHTAAHGKALHKADHRLGKACQTRVHAVFIAPKGAAIGEIARAPGAVELGNITACAKCFIARGIDDHPRDLRVVFPATQGRIDLHRHLVGQRVQRLGAVQRDAACLATAADQDIAHRGPICAVC